MIPVFTSCDTNDTFATLWRKVFQDVTVSQRQRPVGLAPQEDSEVVGRLLDGNPLSTPNDVRRLFDLFESPVVVIFDEYDRVQNQNTRRLMTDVIKLFSDNQTDCTIVLVGVGQSIEELVAAHQSISRNLDFVQ